MQEFDCPQCWRVIRCESFFDHLWHLVHTCPRRPEEPKRAARRNS
jgi:hypothetical protein